MSHSSFVLAWFNQKYIQPVQYLDSFIILESTGLTLTLQL